MNSRDFLRKHKGLAWRLDEWFRALQAKHANRMKCRQGCAQCCYGLFDVSLPDAFWVAQAVAALSADIRSEVLERARIIQQKILREEPELRVPFFLHSLSEDKIDRLVERIQDTRCPFLDMHDCCLVYDDRPFACRLEGIPMVDSQDGLFGDWCELNFKEGIPPDVSIDLRLDYYEIRAIEQEAAEHLSCCLLGQQQAEATVFLPSIPATFENFWKSRIDGFNL
jgi:Fe-S-cluster containining protein